MMVTANHQSSTIDTSQKGIRVSVDLCSILFAPSIVPFGRLRVSIRPSALGFCCTKDQRRTPNPLFVVGPAKTDVRLATNCAAYIFEPGRHHRPPLLPRNSRRAPICTLDKSPSLVEGHKLLNRRDMHRERPLQRRTAQCSRYIHASSAVYGLVEVCHSGQALLGVEIRIL